jgi:uncharacterized protein (TIGR02246 family)
MKAFLFSAIMLLSSAMFAQSKADEIQITKLIDDLIAAYNSHDFTTLKNNSTDDVNWINIVGMWWKGRNEVIGAHNGIFNTIFNGVKFDKKSVSMRSVTDDVMLANVIIHVGEFFPPDGVDRGTNKQKAADDIITLVYVKKGGKWLLTAGQNTVIDANAVPPKR